MEILGMLFSGLIIGLLGKFIAPSHRDNIPLWFTILCGVGGVLLGNVCYEIFGGDGSRGVDWTRWTVTILAAAVLVVIASTVTGRNQQKARSTT